MNLFFNKRNRKQFQVQKIDKAVLAQIMAYSEKLECLRSPAGIRIALAGASDRRRAEHMAGCAPHFLLIFAEEETYAGHCSDESSEVKESQYLNSGYAAGQLMAYLHFLGIQAAIWRNPAVWMQQEAGDGERCVAAVTFGGPLRCAESADLRESGEHPCIFPENREKWAEEVLAFGQTRFGTRQREIQVICRENSIYLMRRNMSGRRMESCWLEAGVVAAGLMAAAEELWIDLTVVDMKTPRCLLALCRRKDRAEVLRTARDHISGNAQPVFRTLGHI